MANEQYTDGTQEYYIVELQDRLKQIDDLAADASAWQFDTYTSAGVPIDVNASAVPFLMDLLCLIDTTQASYIVGTDYRLYVKMIIGSEHPRIGPFKFDIISGT